MRKETKTEQIKVACLKELDALVGKHVTQETPQTFWEEQQVCLRFDSLEEALRSALADVRTAGLAVERVEMEPDALLLTT